MDTSHNTFALNLYNSFALANNGSNILLSPISIFAILSMILPGAKKNTLHQMMKTMHLSSSPPIESTQAELGKMLAAVLGKANSKSHGDLLSANRAYIDAGFQLHPEYLNAIQKHFGAQSYSANFKSDSNAERQRINKWVSEVTKGKITDLLKKESVGPATRLVLVNAVYFKSLWLNSFDTAKTLESPFEISPHSPSITVSMMQKTQVWPLIRVSKVLTGVQFVFKNADGVKGNLSMFAFLPTERHQLDSVLKEMSADDWLQLVNARTEVKAATVRLPKVRMSGEAELSESKYLPSMGLADLFRPTADLSGMASSGLYVSSFAHKAVLEWDEVGAEGAGASGAVVIERMVPKDITFDQPFLVIIAKEIAEADETGPKRVPIFIGRVSDPRQG